MDACTPFLANASVWGERHRVKTSQAAGCRSMKAQTIYANSAEMIYRTNGFDWIKIYGSISIFAACDLRIKNISLSRKTMSLSTEWNSNTQNSINHVRVSWYLFKFWIIIQTLCNCSYEAVSQTFAFNNIYHDNYPMSLAPA